MALQLLRFADTACRFLTACGQLRDPGSELRKWLQEQKDLSARYSVAKQGGYIQFLLGGKSGSHFHVDAAAPEFFGDSPPETTGNVAGIRQAFNRLKGHEIELRITGRYHVPASKSPPIIQSTLAQTTVGDVSIRTAGGRFYVYGAPIETIDWRQPRDGDVLVVELDTTPQTMTIDDDYLLNCLAIVDSAFNAFVLGK